MSQPPTPERWAGMTRQQRVEALTRLAAENLSGGQIAKRLEAPSRSSISGLASRARIKLTGGQHIVGSGRRVGDTPQDVLARRKRIVELAQAGKLPAEIAEIVGLHSKTVSNNLAKARREGADIPKFRSGPKPSGRRPAPFARAYQPPRAAPPVPALGTGTVAFGERGYLQCAAPDWPTVTLAEVARMARAGLLRCCGRPVYRGSACEAHAAVFFNPVNRAA